MALTANPAFASETTMKPTPLAPARLTAILKALAEPRRLQLLERIACSTCSLGCAEALAAMDIAPATLSHHIKELEAADLISTRREGKYVYLSLRADVWQAFQASLATIGQPPSRPAE